MKKNTNREIEVRFLDINKRIFIEKLKSLKAEDLGEDFFDEIIFYDQDLKWQYEKKKIIRLRKTKKGILLAFKQKTEERAVEAKEIEFKVGDLENAKLFLEELGMVAFREQQKKRHTFKLDGVAIDIDTWPSVPTYVELEGESENELKKVAAKLDLKWSEAVFEGARFIIEEKYGIPVSKLHFFTFEKIE